LQRNPCFSSGNLLLPLTANVIDYSPVANICTASGGAFVASAPTPKFGTGAYQWATQAVSNTISLPITSALDFGAFDWTVEGWFYFPSGTYGSGLEFVVQLNAYTSPGYAGLGIWRSGDTAITVVSSSTNINYNVLNYSNITIPTDAWCHLCGQRIGSNVYLTVNGSLAVSGTVSGSYVTGSTILNCIGGVSTSYKNAKMTLQQFRFTKGVGRYGSSFTPPALPFI
jgi:hypothetical protein